MATVTGEETGRSEPAGTVGLPLEHKQLPLATTTDLALEGTLFIYDLARRLAAFQSGSSAAWRCLIVVPGL